MPPVKSSNLTSGREVGEGRKKENYLLARSPCPPINGRKMRLILGVVAQHSRAGWILPQLGVILQAAGDKEVRLNDAAWAGTSRPSLYTTPRAEERCCGRDHLAGRSPPALCGYARENPWRDTGGSVAALEISGSPPSGLAGHNCCPHGVPCVLTDECLVTAVARF